MKRKILLGSILVLVMLLLMPSIPAIQQKTIEDGFKRDLQEKLESITLDDIGVLDGIKHPILRTLVLLFFNFIGLRFAFYIIMLFGVTDTHPILSFICFGRAMLLLLAGTIWAEFWNHISDIFGWGWDIPIP